MAPLLSKSGIIRHSSVVIVANVVSAALSLAYISFVSRTLGPADYSNVTAAVALGNIFLLLLGPLNSALINFSARYHRDRERSRLAGLLFGAMRGLAIPLIAAVGLVGAAGPLLQSILHIDSLAVLIALAIFAALTILAAFPRSVLSGEQRFGAFGANQVVEAAVRLVVGVAAVAIGFQSAGAMSAYTFGITAALVIGLYQLRDLWHVERDAIDVRALFAFSMPVVFLYSFYVFVSNVDMLVVKSTLEETKAGLYGAASGFARLLFIAATPIYLVLFAHVSALHPTQDRRTLTMQVLAFLAIGLAVSLVIPWVLGEWALQLVFGEAYVGAAPILRILWISASLLILQVAAAQYLLAVESLPSAWMFLAPCLLMTLLLWRFHDSTIEVALCSLAGVVGGFVLTGVYLWRTTDNQFSADTPYRELEAPANLTELV